MTLNEYVKTFPRLQRAEVKKWMADQLGVCQSYMRSMCNGTRRIPEKYALRIEKITDNAVPRHATAPDMYPQEEYFSINKYNKSKE